jgi:hypothetical protein
VRFHLLQTRRDPAHGDLKWELGILEGGRKSTEDAGC